MILGNPVFSAKLPCFTLLSNAIVTQACLPSVHGFIFQERVNVPQEHTWQSHWCGLLTKQSIICDLKLFGNDKGLHSNNLFVILCLTILALL